MAVVRSGVIPGCDEAAKRYLVVNETADGDLEVSL